MAENMDLDKKVLSRILRFARKARRPGDAPLQSIRAKEGGVGARTVKYDIVGENQVRQCFVRVTGNGVIEEEFPERFAHNAQVSMRMARDYRLYFECERPRSAPRPIAFALLSPDGGIKPFPEMLPGTRVVEIFESDGGPTYEDMLTLYAESQKGDGKIFDEKELKPIEAMAKAVAAIHKLGYRSLINKNYAHDQDRKRLLYEDHVETILQMVFRHRKFGKHGTLERSAKDKILGLMTDIAEEYLDGSVDVSGRLWKLSGDFSESNILFYPDGQAYLCDESRFPYGERGTDLGWWSGHALWRKYAENNDSHAKRHRAFIGFYNQEIGEPDPLLPRFMCLGLCLLCFVKFNPVFRQKIEPERGKKFIEHVISILERRHFDF